MTRIYLASSIKCVDWTNHIGTLLGPLGFNVVARWIPRVLSRPKSLRGDPLDEALRGVLLAENQRDIHDARATVVLACCGEPRGTFGDAVYALAWGRPVVWVHGQNEGRMLWDSDALVTRIIDNVGNDAELANQIAAALRRALPTEAA